MSKFYIFISIMIGVILFIKLLGDNSSKKEKVKTLYNYKKKDFLITRPEHEFFDILIEILADKYHIFTQVHLPTILDHKIKGQNYGGAFSHINGKSVDFVICDKDYIKPLLAIELDDKSHEREDRILRDGEVERIMEESGMKLIRFENHENFDKEEIKKTILEKLN